MRKKKEIKKLIYGDIIVCKIKKLGKKKLPKGHINRPVFFLKQDRKYLYGIVFTHKKKKNCMQNIMGNGSYLCLTPTYRIKKRNYLGIKNANIDKKTINEISIMYYKFYKAKFVQDRIKCQENTIVIYNNTRFFLYQLGEYAKIYQLAGTPKEGFVKVKNYIYVSTQEIIVDRNAIKHHEFLVDQDVCMFLEAIKRNIQNNIILVNSIVDFNGNMYVVYAIDSVLATLYQIFSEPKEDCVLIYDLYISLAAVVTKKDAIKYIEYGKNDYAKEIKAIKLKNRNSYRENRKIDISAGDFVKSGPHKYYVFVIRNEDAIIYKVEKRYSNDCIFMQTKDSIKFISKKPKKEKVSKLIFVQKGNKEEIECVNRKLVMEEKDEKNIYSNLHVA